LIWRLIYDGGAALKKIDDMASNARILAVLASPESKRHSLSRS